MYQVIVPERVRKNLNKIPETFRHKIIITFSILSSNPFIGKKMRGEYDEHYTYRIWPYRIIYEIKKKKLIVLIVAVGHRQGIYNK